MGNNKFQKELNFAIRIAKYAGKIMLKYLSNNNPFHYKSDNSIVTQADTEINAYLIEQARKYFPTYAVDGEEEKFGKST